MKFAAEKQMKNVEETEEEIQYPAVDKDFLLKEDVTIQEVIEYKRVLEDDFGESKIIETDYIYQDLYQHEGVDYIMEEEEEIVLIEEDKTMEAYLARDKTIGRGFKETETDCVHFGFRIFNK